MCLTWIHLTVCCRKSTVFRLSVEQLSVHFVKRQDNKAQNALKVVQQINETHWTYDSKHKDRSMSGTIRMNNDNKLKSVNSGRWFHTLSSFCCCRFPRSWRVPGWSWLHRVQQGECGHFDCHRCRPVRSVDGGMGGEPPGFGPQICWYIVGFSCVRAMNYLNYYLSLFDSVIFVARSNFFRFIFIQSAMLFNETVYIKNSSSFAVLGDCRIRRARRYCYEVKKSKVKVTRLRSKSADFRKPRHKMHHNR